ncbi:hypothetical protein K445DRAFT_25796 [Daldinia sp. EC12]|nr:hypothetical protein K445DRAFT_25796 [Daldinia sp. EC12]
MQAIDFGYSLLTAEQQSLSPNSTGHSRNGQCHSHRCHSHSCKSAPAEQPWDENSREFEDGHWLFSSKPQLLPSRPTISGTSSLCQALQVPEACKTRPLTPLYGVCLSDCLNGEANVAEQSTSGTSPDAPDLRGKVEVVPSIVLLPPTAQSGTGLNGPLSSESDKLSKLLRDGLSDVKESSKSVDLSSSSQKLKSDTSGSIDWEKINPSPDDNASGKDSNSSSGSENISDEKSCSYLSQHDAQFHLIRNHALNSCPELCRKLDNFEGLQSKREIQNNHGQVDKLRPKVDKSRYWHPLRVRNIVAERFRSLGRRIRRSGSSTFSIRSEFPAPLHSKVRRLLARDSVDIWPSSGEESPLFNTPESDAPNVKRIEGIGRHIDPLAMASMIIATAELNRLSSRASLDQAFRVSRSSTGRSENSPGSHTLFDKDIATPNNETSASVSTALDMPPTTPFNTPLSTGPQSGMVSPVSRTSQRRGQRRRAQRSRLSEITTPGGIASPEDSAEELSDSLPLQVNQIETLPECSCVSDKSNEETLYPKPLTINRGGQDEADTRIGDTSPYFQEDSPCFQLTRPVLLSNSPRREPDTSPQLSGALHSDTEDIIPARVSSIGETPESKIESLDIFETSDEPSLPNMSLGLGFTSLMPTTPSDLTVPITSRGTYDTHPNPIANVESDVPATEAGIDSVTAIDQSSKTMKADSCHPDT